MNAVTPFRPARPAMIVRRAFDDGPAPLGLSEPFVLVSGDRLGADGIAFDLMHEHQPAFLRWVTTSCQALLAAERPWFRGQPLVLTGPGGAGRTHAARRLARAVGAPHVILNLSDPVIAASVASSGQVTEALWASPVTVAMAARQCANPIVSVVGVGQVGDDVVAGFLAMADPVTGRAWDEDRLRVQVDFGEVTWIIQCDDLTRVPPSLLERAAHVAFTAFPRGIETVATLSIMLEVIDDFGLDETDPALNWSKVVRHLGGHHATARQLYREMAQAVFRAARREEPSPGSALPY